MCSEKKTRVFAFFFSFFAFFTQIRMIQSELAFIHRGLHPIYSSKVGSAVPISIIIIHHHFCQSQRAFVNEVRSCPGRQLHFTSQDTVAALFSFSILLLLSLSLSISLSFSLSLHYSFNLSFFLFLFPFVIDIVKAQLLPSMSRSA